MSPMYRIGPDLVKGTFLVTICDSQMAAKQKAIYVVGIDFNN